MALLEVSNVTKSYPARHRLMSSGPPAADRDTDRERNAMITALDDVNLRMETNGALAIVGESGAGKTTLGGLVAGLLQPDSGSIEIDGLTAGPSQSNDRREWYRLVQLVWQNAAGSLDPRMKIARAIAEPMRIRRDRTSATREAVARLMEEVGLSDYLCGRYPHELSGGQVQRAVIARALAVGPRLLVLDEPASALDARVKRKIVELLKHLRQERGMALMVITHDIRLAVQLADEMAIIQTGKIVESGMIDEILNSPTHHFTKQLLRAVPRLPKGVQRPI